MFLMFKKNSESVHLQKHFISIALIPNLNNVKRKMIKLKEKAGLGVGLFLFLVHFYTVLRLYSYLSDNQQKEKR